jgi:hypothetical protein
VAKSAIQYAMDELGIKYVFGAEKAGVAFDCSGLVQWAYRSAGFSLPRTAAEQQRATQKISMAQARPGDLVFYGYPAHHVGIYLGNGKFLEAPHTGDVVKIASVGHATSFGRVSGYTNAFGVGAAAGQAAAAAAARNPAVYTSYGYVADLANSVPDIKRILNEAIKQNWDVQHFQDALRGTSWWKHNSDQAKKMIALSKADPAEYAQQANASRRHVDQISRAMGVKLTDKQARALATTNLFQNFDDASLQAQIGAMFTTVPGGVGGTSVQLDQEIRATAASYGVPVTQAWVNGQIKIALNAGTGIEGATESLQKMAASLYPTLAKEISAGKTVADIAQPYVAQMANTLEIDPGSITLQDPTITKALHGQLPQVGAPAAPAKPGTAAAPPAGPSTLYDFQNALRNDPRWDKTDNAKASAYSMLHQLGQTFGFAS